MDRKANPALGLTCLSLRVQQREKGLALNSLSQVRDQDSKGNQRTRLHSAGWPGGSVISKPEFSRRAGGLRNCGPKKTTCSATKMSLGLKNEMISAEEDDLRKLRKRKSHPASLSLSGVDTCGSQE